MSANRGERIIHAFISTLEQEYADAETEFNALDKELNEEVKKASSMKDVELIRQTVKFNQWVGLSYDLLTLKTSIERCKTHDDSEYFFQDIVEMYT